MKYHKNSYETLKRNNEQCVFQKGPPEAYHPSDFSENYLIDFQEQNKIVLPESLREWGEAKGVREMIYKTSQRDFEFQFLDIYNFKEYKIVSFFGDTFGITIWGILLNGLDDPPVYSSLYEDELKWVKQYEKLSDCINKIVTEKGLSSPFDNK